MHTHQLKSLVISLVLILLIYSSPFVVTSAVAQPADAIGTWSGSFELDTSEHGGALEGVLVPIVVVGIVFLTPVLLVWLVARARYRQQQLAHQTIRELVAAGRELPDNLQELLDTGKSPASMLRSGIGLIGAGIGVGLALLFLGASDAAALGLIPLFIGVARLVVWRLEVAKQ